MICRSQQPVVAMATNQEHTVALTTDEMRGDPDKKRNRNSFCKTLLSFSDSCRHHRHRTNTMRDGLCGVNPTKHFTLFYWRHIENVTYSGLYIKFGI